MKFLGVAVALLSTVSAFAPALVSRETSSTALNARRPFISGNWKLNPQTKEEAVTLAKSIADSVTDATPESDIALFVPYVFIETAMSSVDGKINVGAEVRTKSDLSTTMLGGFSLYWSFSPVYVSPNDSKLSTIV